ncbi:TIGR00374 family protein [Corynebacterium coyleae]|uniref:lysylphosphatidylglycerol synthase transmembrane domain-containing protein n=1 Tax=Corynebacterium coyleae TaxID=53374 RepID=UPI000C75F53B|nr:YbhN family protein [Corynebacterium coyleae]PLA38066.1 TIGR00374 family protein [Corynebacterium coyleae]
MNARTWLRWLAPVVLVVVVLVVLRDQMPFFGDAWRAVRSASPLPLLGTVVTALLALVAMAGVMQILLNVEGRITGVARTNAIVFASNAWSTTVPGGPALSAWLTYRVHRSWGASTGLCGWFFVVSGALSTVWLVLIGIVAVVLLGADLSVTSLVLSLVAAALTIAAVFWATLNPAVLKRWVRFLPSRVHERAVSVIDQVSAIRISAPAFAGAAGLSLCNRLLDLATMVCSVWAVSSSSISLSGICLAFIMTKLAGSAQVTPGGLGTVEPVAVGMLVAGGLSLADATAATVIYRAISFALVTAIGWIVYSAVYLGHVDKPTA